MTIVIKAPAKSRGQMPARILSAQKPRVLLPLAPDGLPPTPKSGSSSTLLGENQLREKRKRDLPTPGSGAQTR